MQGRISIFIAALLLPIVALSQPIGGASYIGICNPNFPCSRALEVFKGKDEIALGYLADAFGHKCKCVERFINLPATYKYVRVHIANGTCFPERGRRCAEFDVFRGETQKSAEKKVLKRDSRLMLRYHNSIKRTRALLKDRVIARYGICMECPFQDRARRILANKAARLLPAYSLVDSVLQQKCLNGLICERHGDNPKYLKSQRCISDTDGISLFNANLERLKKKSKQCEAIFYWSYGYNLIPFEYRGRFVPPHQRSYRAPRWELDGARACIEQ